MRTARQLADEVWEAQQESWEFDDPTSSILAAERLNPDDERVVRRITAANGYTGDALDSMSRRVSALVVGQVGAMADAFPAMAGD
jgi:hypothetical protein